MRLFLKGYPGDWRQDTDESRGVPPPPIQKRFPADAKLVDLVAPGNLSIGNVPLARLVRHRRTHRDYTSSALSNEELSFLLWCTQGISGPSANETPDVPYTLRTVPSAGARHPFETYLLLRNVEGIPEGIYRFLPLEHKLLTLCERENLGWIIETLCYGQQHLSDAAAVFIWSALPYRMEWRYGYIAHRLIAIEAGHVCQNLQLAAESIHAGSCAVSGYDQGSMDKLIGVDGKEEFTIYLASVGKKATPGHTTHEQYGK